MLIVIGFYHIMHNMEKGPLCHMWEYVNGEGLDEHARLVSLIWAFSVFRHILQYQLILAEDKEGLGQPA